MYLYSSVDVMATDVHKILFHMTTQSQRTPARSRHNQTPANRANQEVVLQTRPAEGQSDLRT